MDLSIIMASQRLFSSMIRCPQRVLFRSTIAKSHHKAETQVGEKDLSKLEPANNLDPLSRVTNDQTSFIKELVPPIKRSFNLAAYTNQSKTLQDLVRLGVSLYDIEHTNRKAAQYYVTLDFEQDCIEHIKFLVDNGLKETNLGRFITEYPMIFEKPLDDLQTRINYFEHKRFSKSMIANALNKSARILMYNTKTIDHKLGQLQIEFKLPAKTLRNIVTNDPNVIALPEEQYKLVNFSLEEEFGFHTREIHQILEAQPSLMMFPRALIVERLDIVHNQIGLSHSMIVKYPKLITAPKFDVLHRYQYLKKLNRDQFDPTKPLYVPPSALYNLDDEDFCSKYAKTSLGDFQLFLKTR